MDVLEILENHEARLRRLTKSLEELILNGGGGLKIFNSITDFPIPGDPDFIYLDQTTGISYYWDGTQYLPLAHAELSFQTFATAADFPNPGTPGVLYLAEDTGEIFFWNGTDYVSAGGGLKVFADVAAFPVPGQPTFLYYAILEKSLYYWDGTQYLPVVDPTGFIQNQIASPQTANYWIKGEGRITSDGTATNLTLQQTNPANAAVIAFSTPQVPLGYLAFGETSNPANIMSLIVPSTGAAWHFHKGALITNSFEDGVGASVVLKNLVLSKTSDDTGLSAGAKAAILYDGEFGAYRMVIKPNGNWIVGGGVTDNGARFQIEGGGATVTTPGQGAFVKVTSNYGDIGPDPPQLELVNTAQNGRVWVAMKGAPSAGDAYFQLFSKGDLGNYSNKLFIQATKGFAFLAGDGAGGTAPTYFGTGGISDPLTMILSASRNVLIGSQSDNGARLQVGGGTLSLANNAADYPGVNGAMFYRSDIHKYRVFVNGVWKNLATEDSITVTGHILYVDKDSVTSTDTRTGISNYSLNFPFKTIQAAVNAAVHGDVIEIRNQVYTEQITISNKTLRLKLVNSYIQFTDNANAVITTVTNPVSITGDMESRIVNLGTGRAVYFSFLSTTDDVTLKDTQFISAGTQAFSIQTVSGGIRNWNVDGCIFKGNFDEVNVPGHPNPSTKIFNCEITGNVTLYSNTTFNNCKITGTLVPWTNTRVLNSSIVSPQTAGTYMFDMFFMYPSPSGLKAFFQNCVLKGNSVFFLRDGGSGWDSTCQFVFHGCQFELVVGAPEGFGFWQYNVSQHRVVISSCFSNVDFLTGYGLNLIGANATVMNSGFVSTYKTGL